MPNKVNPQSGIAYSHALPTGYARNWIADCERLMDGNLSVYKVFTPLPTRQKAMPIVHMRRVRHGRVGSSSLKPTPAADRTSSTDSPLIHEHKKLAEVQAGNEPEEVSGRTRPSFGAATSASARPFSTDAVMSRFFICRAHDDHIKWDQIR